MSDDGDERSAEDNRLSKMRRVIQYQLDLEILHKWREIIVIEEEMERGRLMQQLIDKLIMNEHVYGDGSYTSRGFEANAASFAGGHRASFNGPGQMLPDHRRRLGRGASTGSMLGATINTSEGGRITSNKPDRVQTEPTWQYDIRPDGQVVRMQCPKCGSDRFRSMLGFLNHCRIHCHLHFSSQDDRLYRCGVVIDPAEVPADYFNKHPSLVKQEMDLALIRADVTGPVMMMNSQNVSSSSTNSSSVAGASLQARSSAVPISIGLAANSIGEPSLLEDTNSSTNAVMSRIDTSSGPSLTRFYRSHTVIVGNSAKRVAAGSTLTLDQREKDAKDLDEEEEFAMFGKSEIQPTHRWKVYIRSPRHVGKDQSNEVPVESFIRAVRFHLHPSYKPNHVVDVLKPPFELVRYGWGDFPIRMQIFFWDQNRNRPMEIIHHLKVTTVSSPKFSIAAEQAYRINYHRRSQYREDVLSDAGLPLEVPSSGENQEILMAMEATTKQAVQDGVDLLAKQKSMTNGFDSVNSEEEEKAAKEADMELLALIIHDFPLAGRKGKRAKVTASLSKFYRPADTPEDFLHMDLRDQRYLEWHRADALVTHIATAFPNKTFSMNARQVLEWCRLHGHTPASVATMVDAMANADHVDPQFLQYCRFCGLAHQPQERFDILQKNCTLRPRKVHVSTRTPAKTILDEFSPSTASSEGIIYTTTVANHPRPFSSSEHAISTGSSLSHGKESFSAATTEEILSTEDSSFGNGNSCSLIPWISEVLDPVLPSLPCLMEGDAQFLSTVEFVLTDFLRTLITRSVAEIPNVRDAVRSPRIRANSTTVDVIEGFLTPLHVFRVISNQPAYDFLCNNHMSYTPNNGSKKSATSSADNDVDDNTATD